MKTLFLFEQVPEESCFFEMEGDFSRFNGVYINGCGPEGQSKADRKRLEQLQQELNDLVFNDDTGDFKCKKIVAPTKDWDVFVKCGFYL